MDIFNIINTMIDIIRSIRVQETIEQLSQITGVHLDPSRYVDYLERQLTHYGIEDVSSTLNKLKWIIDCYNNVLQINSPDIPGSENVVKFKALKIVVENFIRGFDVENLNLDSYVVICLGVFLTASVFIVYKVFKGKHIEYKKMRKKYKRQI